MLLVALLKASPSLVSSTMIPSSPTSSGTLCDLTFSAPVCCTHALAFQGRPSWSGASTASPDSFESLSSTSSGSHALLQRTRQRSHPSSTIPSLSVASLNMRAHIPLFLRSLGSQAVKITLSRSMIPSWTPGQHAFLICPSVSRLPFEAHPFTVSFPFDAFPLPRPIRLTGKRPARFPPFPQASPGRASSVRSFFCSDLKL